MNGSEIEDKTEQMAEVAEADDAEAVRSAEAAPAKKRKTGLWARFLRKSIIPFTCLVFMIVAMVEMRSSMGQYKTNIVGIINMPEAKNPAASIVLIPNLSDSTDWPKGTDAETADPWSFVSALEEDLDGDITDYADRIKIGWSNNQSWVANIAPGEDAYEYAKILSQKREKNNTEPYKVNEQMAILREMQLDVRNYVAAADLTASGGSSGAGGSATGDSSAPSPAEDLVSETALRYTIRIRSLNVLPLEFTLTQNTTSGIIYYRSKCIIASDKKSAEYTFYRVNVTETELPTEKEGDTAETVRTESLSTAEAEFEMKGPLDWTDEERAADDFTGKVTDSFSIYAGWATEGTGIYDASLRKEVDRLKVIVTVENISEEERNLPDASPTVAEPTTTTATAEP